VQFSDRDGAFSRIVYSNGSVWVRNNLPLISNELDDIEVGSNPVTISLTEYGFDIETSKSELTWKADPSSKNNKFFIIDTKNIDNQEILIIPVKSKTGKDDISIILIDSDGGYAVNTDIIIIVGGEGSEGVGDKTDPDEDDGSLSKFMTNTNYVFIYLFIIILIIIAILFVLFSRKKRKQKDISQKEEEIKEPLAEHQVERLQPESESTESLPETPIPTPVPIVEQPKVPTPVPMPVEAPKPQLPEATEIPSAEPITEQPTAEPQPEQQPDTQIDNTISNKKPPQGK
jgi:preprotein translocase subunit SecG